MNCSLNSVIALISGAIAALGAAIGLPVVPQSCLSIDLATLQIDVGIRLDTSR
jgi:hypothetical protein